VHTLMYWYCFMLRCCSDSARWHDGRREGRPMRRSSDHNFSMTLPDWNRKELVPTVKAFYQPSEDAAVLSDEELAAIYKEHHIKIKGNDIPQPIKSFAEAGLPGEDQVHHIVNSSVRECAWNPQTSLDFLSSVRLQCFSLSGLVLDAKLSVGVLSTEHFSQLKIDVRHSFLIQYIIYFHCWFMDACY